MEETLEFINDQKVLMTHLVSFNENLKGMLPIKQAEKAYYKQFSLFLDKYEETKNKASGQQGELAHIRLVSSENEGGLKQKMEAIGT